MIRVLINGICGQMGRAVYTAVLAQDDFEAVAGVDMTDAPAGVLCPVYRTFDEVQEDADVIIDFSVPAALPSVLRYALRKRIPVVVGTTGLSERDSGLLQKVSERIPVFQTGNMSVGVNLQMALTKMAASALGSDYDVEITEKHHRMKIDAPSGTALMLADCVRSQHAGALEYVFGRHEKNKRRTDSEIGIHSIRGGTIVGEHEVAFIGSDEIVEITHKAYSKQVFVRGALRAARFIVNKENGRYNMQNVVAEHDVASHLYVLEDQAVVSLSDLPHAAGLTNRVLGPIAEKGVVVDMIALSICGENRCCIGFSLKQSQLPETLVALKSLQQTVFPEMNIYSHGNVVKLTVEGTGMTFKHGVAADLLGVLAGVGIPVQLITTSETKIEFCVDVVEATKAIEEVKTRFLL